MSACGSSSGDHRGGHVSHRMYLQLVCSPSRVEQNKALWACLYTSHGRRIDGSYLDGPGGVNLQDRTSPLGRTQASRTFSKESPLRPSGAETTARATSQTSLA